MSKFPRVQLRHLSAIPIANGLGLPGSNANPEWPRYIRTTDIASPTRLRDDVFASQPPEVASSARVAPGDLLMTAAGSIGKSVRFTESYPACYAGFLVRLRPRSTDEGRYIGYWMQSVDYWDQIAVGAVKSTIENFSASRYRGLTVPLPPLDEQRAIVDYLDHETAQIDALVAKQEEFISLLRERRGAVTDAEFQNSEGRRRVTIQQALVRLNRLPLIGSGVVTAYRDGAVTLRTNRRSDGYTMSAAEAGYQGVVPGDIVFHGLDGFAGAVGISDSEGQCSPVYHVCKTRYEDDVEYLALLIRYLGTSGFLSTQAPNTRQRSVDFRNWGTFARVPLMLPSIEHQKKFVAQYYKRIIHVDALIVKAKEHIALAKERRSALITAAVTGQFDVRTAQKAA